ncbi:uracil-DNA glycosylase [Kroppenstedtia eburnea]|uniref:Uracil-DNA glycosylase n=1 Tax=Kroppenstedtia eburnea TaxID=714067 RepID=A0A1N7IY65_9BACL|nr:uracil-DNA glycosylase [Kroppenstedtia eburnea]EGK13369.1 uracil-DNA glycosylase [Desmospora sp. 8437]QKI82312.1 uracil-DNA glycosylase [Kroppenstedtia eburnea]SIS41947.1 Uracil-DNA glycosylase [Kroppenstedtia eburnea]
MAFTLPQDWQQVLAEELKQPYLLELKRFLENERKQHPVYPPEEDLFSALALTPYDQVKVLLLGQDPYHNDGQAHGLSFSVRPGVPLPPSLKNMFKELEEDLGHPSPNNGHLVPWARQGVLMLNTVLTVRAHEANSHKNKGWETFTDAVIRKVNEKPGRVVFVLWGNHAKKKKKWIDTDRHTIIESAHPSPLSAKRGFFGSRPFSAINRALSEAGLEEIDWRIPNI